MRWAWHTASEGQLPAVTRLQSVQPVAGRPVTTAGREAKESISEGESRVSRHP